MFRNDSTCIYINMYIVVSDTATRQFSGSLAVVLREICIKSIYSFIRSFVRSFVHSLTSPLYTYIPIFLPIAFYTYQPLFFYRPCTNYLSIILLFLYSVLCNLTVKRKRRKRGRKRHHFNKKNLFFFFFQTCRTSFLFCFFLLCSIVLHFPSDGNKRFSMC